MSIGGRFFGRSGAGFAGRSGAGFGGRSGAGFAGRSGAGRHLRVGVLALVLALGFGVGLAWAELPAVALAAQDPVAAIPALEAALAQHAQLAPALGLLLAEARLKAGDAPGALVAAQAVLAAEPPWAARAAWVAAQALPADACEPARRLLARAAEAPPAVVAPAERLAWEVRVLTACGDVAEATARRRTLAVEQAHTPEGAAAAHGLALSLADRFAQAAALERARAHAEAAAALEALAAEPEAQDQARFERARLEVDRLRRDFRGAATTFATLSAGAGPWAEEATWQHARALGRAGDLPAAIAAFQAYRARYPSGRHADEARFFEVFTRYEGGEYGAAAEGFAALLKPGGLAPGSTWAGPAAWYHAFCLFLAEDAGAAAALDALAAAAPEHGAEHRRAAYWAMRARVSRDPVRAAVAAVRLVNARPIDWYALLIQAEWPEVFPDRAPLPPADAALGPADRAALARPEAARTRWPTLDEAERVALDLALALAEAGLAPFAHEVLQAAAPRLRGAQAPLLQAVALQVGAPGLALRSAMGARSQRAVEVPEPGAPPEDLLLWRAAWPAGYGPEVAAAAARHAVDPALVQAFIRKESAFAPGAVSPAHALGLMQLLGRTAALLEADGHVAPDRLRRGRATAAPRPGAAVSAPDAALEAPAPGSTPEAPRPLPADLFDPATNIELGTAYVAALEARFGGQRPLVAAAYNAGPGAVLSWFGGRRQARLDVFVENIPFRETREYVKRLTEGHLRVGLIHEGRGAKESLRRVPVVLDLSVRPGVDF